MADPVRPPLGAGAVTAGIGSGAVLEWAWAGYMVPRGHPPMPIGVAEIVVGVVIAAIEAAKRMRRRPVQEQQP